LNTTLLSILSLLAGAAIQYVFTRYLEDQRHYRALRTQAYTDFLKYSADITYLEVEREHPDHEGQKPYGLADEESARSVADDKAAKLAMAKELLARLTDSKARICLYGSEVVVERMACFERLGAVMRSVEQRSAFVQIVAAMRAIQKYVQRLSSATLNRSSLKRSRPHKTG